MWPQVITQLLWPCEFFIAVDDRNKHKLDKDYLSQIDRLITVKNSFNLKENQTFGCPEFSLTASLQDRKIILRWDERIRVGVYLGRFKQHESNADLILNLKTGHVIPQFHTAFDNNFETVDSLQKGVESKIWKWLVRNKRECHADDK